VTRRSSSVEFTEEESEEVVAPELAKRVKVLPPFLVNHAGTSYWPNAVVEVPESVAAHWLLNSWVEESA